MSKIWKKPKNLSKGKLIKTKFKNKSRRKLEML